MLYGIEMDVIDVTSKVGFVANGMLPIAALPNPFLAFGDFAGAALWIAVKVPRESSLDQAPTQRKISITSRQQPDGMEMIWQYADRDRLEGIPLLYGGIDFPQVVDMPHQQITRPVGKRHCEEKNTASNFGTAISGHGRMTLSFLALRENCVGAWAKARNTVPQINLSDGRLCPPYGSAPSGSTMRRRGSPWRRAGRTRPAPRGCDRSRRARA